ncbi:MAG: DUF4870 domain-containing protein [Brooklawnia sp.]
MTNAPQWPLLNNTRPAPADQHGDAKATESQRDQVERLLHQALREGRIGATDFERRFTQAMNAARASQLRAAVADMPAPITKAVVAVQGYRQPTTNQHRVTVPATPTQAQAEARVAALAHASALFTWIVGPALFFATARPGGFVRIQAAKAFNFQLTAGILTIGATIVLAILGLGSLAGLLTLAWLGLTIANAVQAGKGVDWDNPLARRINIEAMPTDGR